MDNQGASVPEWKRLTITPYRSYEVSSDGRIRRDGKELMGTADRQGYKSVLLYYAGSRRRFKLHRLICEAFNGPAPEGSDCAHADGNPGNNAASNLRWATRSENMLDASKHGTLKYPVLSGASHPNAKLTPELVAEIRSSDEPHRALARRLSVSDGTIRKIRKGDLWATA